MLDTYALTLADLRADGGVRHVALSPRMVTIRRSYRDIAMRLAIPARQFRGVVARPVADGPGLRHEIALLHRDSEFDIPLCEASDARAAVAEVGRWAEYFGLAAVPAMLLYGEAAAPYARRRSAMLTRRRRRHWARRKPGWAVNPAG